MDNPQPSPKFKKENFFKKKNMGEVHRLNVGRDDY